MAKKTAPNNKKPMFDPAEVVGASIDQKKRLESEEPQLREDARQLLENDCSCQELLKLSDRAFNDSEEAGEGDLLLLIKSGFESKLGKPKFVSLSGIVADGLFRVRTKEKREQIQELVDLFYDYRDEENEFRSGKAASEPEYPFRPIVYWKHGNKKHLIAGYHRYFAAREATRERILAVEFKGSKVEALFFAICDNRMNGSSYERGDKQLSVIKVLTVKPDASLSVLVKIAKASKTLCSVTRKKFFEERKGFTSEPPPETEEPTDELADDTKVAPSVQKKKKSIVYWKRLDYLPVKERVEAFFEAIDKFSKKLPEEDRRSFHERLADWLNPEPLPTETPV